MLWRGMLPAIYRHAIYTGIRMSAYEEVRNNLQRKDKVISIYIKHLAYFNLAQWVFQGTIYVLLCSISVYFIGWISSVEKGSSWNDSRGRWATGGLANRPH